MLVFLMFPDESCLSCSHVHDGGAPSLLCSGGRGYSCLPGEGTDVALSCLPLITW